MFFSSFGLFVVNNVNPTEVNSIIFPLQMGALSLYLFMHGKEKSTSDIVEIRKLYEEVISDYNKINRDIGLKNPMEISTLFEQAYRNGYLSKGKNFELDNKNVIDINNIQGANIINGKGVCRHLSNMLNDIYTDLDIDSNLLYVYLRNRIPIISFNQSSESNNILNNEIISIDYIIEPKKGIFSSNHVINQVNYDGKVFFIDPTNFTSYKLNQNDHRFLMDSIDPKIYIDQFSLLNEPKFKQQRLLPSTTFEEDEEIRNYICDIYRNNLDIFENFYQEHVEIYDEISDKIMKIKKR